MRVIIGIILIALGGWMIAAGVAYSSGGAPSFSVPGGDVVGIVMGFIPPALLDLPLVGDYGALVPFGVVGLIVGFYGLRMMTNSGDMGDPFDEEEELSAEQQDQIPIGELVNMAQGTLVADQVDRVIDKLRPELTEYKALMNPGAVESMARIALQHAILHYQRESKKDVTADQYQTQGKRMAEVENKTFALRYMPKAGKATTEKMKKAQGRIYDLTTESAMAQEFSSDSKDWQEVTLENLPIIMQTKPAAVSAAAPAAAASPAAPAAASDSDSAPSGQ